jgi:phosphoribosylformylglycinamidine synthase subunit PurSL
LNKGNNLAMLWEIEITPIGADVECERVIQEYDLLTQSALGRSLLERATRGFLLQGELNSDQADHLLEKLLLDPLVEEARMQSLESPRPLEQSALTVLPKPGVMDPVALSVIDAARDLGHSLQAVRTFRRFYLDNDAAGADVRLRRVLANDAIEELVSGNLGPAQMGQGRAYDFHLRRVPLTGLDDDALREISRRGQLALSVAEMRTIQAHFESQQRDPTDIELETIAQTWSEHCSHKTLKGKISLEDREYSNLLKETIFAATDTLRKQMGADDWCVSVFEDNAGVVRFDENFHVCFKVETHNRPSAIEPYGGANTGLGGVIRDPLGTGLGAEPVCNTDVFCFAPPETPANLLPPGILHPRKIMSGVVTGVKDYGNRMGIPTVNGAVCFDDRYLGNPLVFCGTVGMLPVDRCQKKANPGDWIVTVGGRTGRDGIHGATFSSIELTSESEQISGGAVQIGNAIFEKKMLDVLLVARDRGLFSAITDCGAGGFSSAVGEMGADLGASVHLEKAPLKYQGLSYTEIWISEAQERMVLAVPPQNWPALQSLCASEDVEATVLGTFESTGRLKLFFEDLPVGDLDLHFLHEGRPPIVRQARWTPNAKSPEQKPKAAAVDFNAVLQQILSSYNVCSKESIIRQYDHEVRGATMIKPLVGVNLDGPGDAAVMAPILGSRRGFALGCGIQPRLGDLDPYHMAAAAIDEAVRNVVSVGADPARIALLDNFCWGDTDRPEVLGSLVRAAEACRDLALAFRMPFISGKDSLKNEFRSAQKHIIIPPTLLISAIGLVHDVQQCVTMDLKSPGNELYLLGATREELAGSHFDLVTGQESQAVPVVDPAQAPKLFASLHTAIRGGMVRSCHDLSEGGLAVSAAEMAFAGGIGADLVRPPELAGLSDTAFLFSESTTRFLLEVEPGSVEKLKYHYGDLPLYRVGTTGKQPRLRIAGSNGEWLIWAPLDQLKEAWQKPLRS